MKHFYLAILISFATVLATTPSWGQDRENLISGDFQELKFSDFIQRVEAQTSYFFYFDKTQFDSLTVSFKAEQQTLKAILDSLFTDTKFYHLISKSGKVYLTKGREIRDELPVGFFDSKAGQEDFDIAMFDLMHNVDEKKAFDGGGKTFRNWPAIKNCQEFKSYSIRLHSKCCDG